MQKIYLGTVALEKNRWAPGRIPTFQVSDLLEKVREDGFSGIELWEYHYLSADREEQKRLADAPMEYIFNSYLSLKNGVTEHLKETARAIRELGAVGVKYNFGHRDFDSEPGYTEHDYVEQTETLLRFADLLPADVKLLCECHANTLMEYPERAGRVFEKLDERFGAIIHLKTGRELAEKCFDAYGDRICHIHAANSVEGIGFCNLEDNGEELMGHLEYYKSRGFKGSLTVEFTKNSDSVEGYYEAAVKDLAFLKKEK